MKLQKTNKNKSFLEMLDIYESSITFSYNNSYSYDTKFGGLLTIISFVVLLCYSVLSIISLFQGNNYTLISNESEDYKYILDFSKIPFAFKLVNAKGQDFPYDPTIYNYKIIDTEYYYKQNSNNKTIEYKEESIEYDYCEKFIGKNKFYNFLNVSNLLCIKPGQNLTMYGKFGDYVNGFKGFRIFINRCNLEIENNTCKDIEIINEKLSNIKFTFFYLGYEVNHYSSNKKVIQYKIFSETNNLSVNFMKKFYYKFQKANYYLYDDRFFTNNKKNLSFYLFDGYEYDFELDSSNGLASTDDSLGFFAFNTNSKVIEYKKKLNTLWDIIAKIGGVFNIVVSISKIINSLISRKILLLDVNENLINECSPDVMNNNQFNEYVDPIVKKIDSLKCQNKGLMRIDNSSVEINNKKEKLMRLKSYNDFKYRNKNKNFVMDHISNFSNFERKNKTSIKVLQKFKIRNKHSSKFLFFICPFFILKRIPKLKYLNQIEQNFCECFSIENFLKVLELNKIIFEKNSQPEKPLISNIML